MVKNILFKMTLAGRGIVNYDSASQNSYLRELNVYNTHSIDNNFKFSKKVFFKTGRKNEKGDDIYDYKIKISQNCLRRHIFNDDVEFTNSQVTYSKTIFCNYLTSIVGLTRGYTYPAMPDSGMDSVKRVSSFTICDAIQTNGAKTYIETCTRGGSRDDTSLFNVETVGDITYGTMGNIDLQRMQFISCDPIYDRLAVSSDWCVDGGIYVTMIKNKYGDIYNGTCAHYILNSETASTRLGENGILLNKEMIVYLTKELLKRFLGISIKRAGAYANVDSLQIKYVENALNDTFDNEDGWITLRNEAEIDALDFDPNIFYRSCDEEEIRLTKNEMEPTLLQAAKIAEKKRIEKEAQKEVSKQRRKEKNELAKAKKNAANDEIED